MTDELSRNVALENIHPRPDIRLKVTGAARYTSDITRPDMIWARFIRFPYGAGRVLRADVDAARKVPGVLEVELDTGKEARYAGERLGHIVAETPRALDDAMAALNMQIQPLPARTDPISLRKPVPACKPEDQQKLDEIFQQAAAVVEGVWTTQVQTHACLETHCAVIDHQGERAEAWASTQGTFAYLEGLPGPTGLDSSKIVVHNEFVGGGFGSKFGPGAEGDLAARMSRKYRRPCKIVLNRKEEHLDTGNRPGSIQYMKVAADKDGRLMGGRFHLASVVGYEPAGGGVQNPIFYNFGFVVKTTEDIPLSAGLPRPMRAPGFPQGVFGVDTMMDELAAKLKMDPIKFRQINEQSDRRRRQYDIAADVIGWSRRRPDGAWPGRLKRGFGCAGSLWFAWPNRATGAEVEIFPSGQVEVRAGVQDIGTGCSAVLLDVCADHLQIERRFITSRLGNSTYPQGPASGGSVTSLSVAPAVRDAAENALTELKTLLAREWKLSGPEMVTYQRGLFGEQNGSRSADWRAVCALLPRKLSVRGKFNEKYFGRGSSDGVQLAEVEVDTETGIVRVVKVVAVQACGVPVNRLTAENQICGGVVQGIGFALFENRWLDRRTGAMVNPNLEFYKVPGSLDVPEIIPILDRVDEDTGVRSLGEPATIPTAAAIANAVSNAIGVRVRSLPITPALILAALEEKPGMA
ncbi:MAG: xanthine dehydrogenase family protein molybdopterin-binding subunit [Candidatus Sumerlaeia bacterium]